MNGTALLVLLLVVFVPLTAFVGLGLWARWLCLRTAAPRLLVYPPASLPAAIAGLGLVIGMLRAGGTIGGGDAEVGHGARLLGQGISEAMNCTAIGMVLAVVATAWMLGLTWRYRWSRR